MASNSDDKEAAPKKTSFCQRNKSRNGSFVSTLRNHFHEFIHAPMDQNKTCLADTFQKLPLLCIADVYSATSSIPLVSREWNLA
ncbi:hypothetical protein Ahy_B05g079360 isoform A [Arachis hypogaea]|uniref:Uncharacterized protein n=1 Tax=Arachis hypogaea TaxID=3818 RepID=A0A444Z9M5_ARAHY|nr:hypothetical protein Ahy_B05g079360 isoform A [Arachis hypogaea]